MPRPNITAGVLIGESDSGGFCTGFRLYAGSIDCFSSKHQHQQVPTVILCIHSMVQGIAKYSSKSISETKAASRRLTVT